MSAKNTKKNTAAMAVSNVPNVSNDNIMANIAPIPTSVAAQASITNEVKDWEDIVASIRENAGNCIAIGRKMAKFDRMEGWRKLNCNTQADWFKLMADQSLWSKATACNWQNAAILADVTGISDSDILRIPLMTVYAAGSMARKVSDANKSEFSAFIRTLIGTDGPTAKNAFDAFKNCHDTDGTAKVVIPFESLSDDDKAKVIKADKAKAKRFAEKTELPTVQDTPDCVRIAFKGTALAVLRQMVALDGLADDDAIALSIMEALDARVVELTNLKRLADVKEAAQVLTTALEDATANKTLASAVN